MTVNTDIDLAALQIFQAVATSGSMSAAGRELQLTQSAISQAIQKLESRLGVELFDRQLRPLALTPAGLLLRERAQQLLDDATDLVMAVRLSAKRPTVTLRICIPESIAPLFAAPLAMEASRLAATSLIRTRTKQPSVEAFLAREVDILITPDPMVDLDGIEHHNLTKDEPYILLVPDRFEGDTSSVTAVSQSGLPFLGYISTSYTARLIGGHLRRIGIAIGRHQQVDVMSSLVQLVASGAGWTVVSPLSFAASGFPKGVLALPLAPSLRRSLSMVARKVEFGTIPGQLAHSCRSIIQTQVTPTLAQRLPWLGWS